jgi:transcriptional regulator with XRE-family HTH domain
MGRSDSKDPRMGERIAELRKKAGKTQQELADAIGMPSRSSLAEIETGHRNVHAYELQAMANFLGVAISDFYPDGEMAEEGNETEIKMVPVQVELQDTKEGYEAHMSDALWEIHNAIRLAKRCRRLSAGTERERYERMLIRLEAAKDEVYSLLDDIFETEDDHKNQAEEQ